MLIHASKGVHLLCELTGCDAQVLASVEAVKTAVEEAAARARVTVLHGFYHRFTPTGVSAILCIAESHLSVHTWPELGYAAADVYTCGDHTLPRMAAEVLTTAFRARRNSMLEVARGDRDQDGTFRSMLVHAPAGTVRLPPGHEEDEGAGPAPLIDGADAAQRHVYAVERRLADEHSAFHHIEIAETKALGKVLSLDGAIQSSGLDEHVYHEALVHPAMLMHPQPQEVLVLGGGEGASLREVLRHPTVRAATMIDIDGRLVELCARHLPEWSAGAFDDPRSRVSIADGKAWVEESSARFDVIIMDLTDQIDLGPSFPLYTQDFLRELRDHLRPGGLLVVQAGELSPCEHFSHATIRRTLGGLFKQVWSYAQFVPAFAGEWSFVIATDAELALPGPAEVDAAVARRLPQPLRFLDGRTFARMFTLSRETVRMLDSTGVVNVDRESFARARMQQSSGNPDSPALVPAMAADVKALWPRYRRSPATFLTDIDGPEPELTEAGFAALCSAPDVALYVMPEDGAVHAHVLLKDLDREAGVATAHVGCDGAAVQPGGAAAVRLREGFDAMMAAEGLARAQAFVLDSDIGQRALLRALGFVDEGVLRQQFRHGGILRDLAVLGRCSPASTDDRTPAMAPAPRPFALRRQPTVHAVGKNGSGPRLVARPLAPADRAQVHAWLREPGIQDLLDDHPLSSAGVDDKVARMLAPPAGDRTRSYVLQLGDRCLGLLCFLFCNDDSGTAEVDLLVPAGAALDSLLVGRVLWTVGKTAFDGLGLHKVYAFVYGSNQRCLRTLSRCMRVEARLRDYRPRGNAREPACVFGLLASEFRAVTPSQATARS